MSLDIKNPIMSPISINTPSSALSGTRGLFPRKDGWYDIDESGNITSLGGAIYVNLSIDNHGLVADKTAAEVYQLYKENKNVFLLFSNVETDTETGTQIMEEHIYSFNGAVGDDIIFVRQFNDDLFNFEYITASVKDNTWKSKTCSCAADLSDYYTKEETRNAISKSSTDTHDSVLETVSNSYLTLWDAGKTYATKEEVGEAKQNIYDLQADIVGREEKSNKTNTINDQPSTDKYPSEAAVFNYVMSVANDLKLYIGDYSYSKDEVNAAIQSAIGDVLGGAS